MEAISPSQCRAARALLDWTRERLSEVSGVPLRTLTDFEAGATTPRAGTVSRLIVAFAQAGIAFVEIRNATGGVILMDRRDKE